MLAVYKKELKSYFNSMIGYIFIAFLLFLVSMFFCLYNLFYGSPLLRNTLSGVSFVFFIIVPVLTMRIMADEKRQKTDQLLYTAPVKISSIVIGKYMSMLTVLLIPILIIGIYPLIMGMYGKSSTSYAMDYISLLGFFLMGALYLSIGLFLSTLTESQVIAAVMTFAILMLTYFIGGLLSMVPGTAAASLVGFSIVLVVVGLLIYMMTKNVIVASVTACVLEIIMIVLYFAKKSLFEGAFTTVFSVFNCSSRLNNFLYGIFDISGIMYYVTGSILFIFLTVQAVQKSRYS